MTDSGTPRPPRYAIIPTHNRPIHLHNLVRQLTGSCDMVVIIDNASEPSVGLQLEDWPRDENHPLLHIIRDDEQPPNLPKMWNYGLQFLHTFASPDHDVWDVAILNDDAELPEGWYDYVAGALRRFDVLAASGDAYGSVSEPLVRRDKHTSLTTRMCPWAFVIRGECGVEADERLRWWWQDTDLEWRLAIAGGVVVMPGFIARNVGANSSTVGVLAEQAGRDRATFHEKWGIVPW